MSFRLWVALVPLVADAHSYFRGPHGMVHEVAQEWCEAKGGVLAIIDDGTDNERARVACGEHTCWIGLAE